MEASGQVSPSRVEQLEREARRVVDALTQAQRTRQLLFLVLIAFVCVTCYAYYRLATRYEQKEQLDLLLTKAQDQLERRSDFLSQQAQSLVDETAPVVSAAFLEQAKRDVPGFLQAVDAERDKLLENLVSRLEQRLAEHQHRIIERHHALLEQEFPDVKDSHLHDAMLKNLEMAFDKLVNRYYIDTMRNEILQIYADWDQFPMVDAVQPGDTRLEDEFQGALLELLKMKLAETPANDESEAPAESKAP
jgi:cell division protein FtsB